MLLGTVEIRLGSLPSHGLLFVNTTVEGKPGHFSMIGGSAAQ
jgi:hypothetical protein